MLNKGQWQDESPRQLKGELLWQQPSSFQSSILPTGSSINDLEKAVIAEPGRYVLYTSLATPIAHCAVILRTLKRLERLLPICLVNAKYGDQGWSFKKTDVGTNDIYNSSAQLHELYSKQDSQYSGETSLPLLWDRERKQIVTNSPQQILHILNSSFDNLHELETPNLYPDHLTDEIQETNNFLMNEMFRNILACGFSENASVYQKHFDSLFRSLEELNIKLERQSYLLGDQITICDWLLFTILVRFDAVYSPLFKCNKKALSDFPFLANYFGDLYQERHIGVTVNTAHIKEHYFKSYTELNPSGEIPTDPDLDFDYLFNRSSLL